MIRRFKRDMSNFQAKTNFQLDETISSKLDGAHPPVLLTRMFRLVFLCTKSGRWMRHGGLASHPQTFPQSHALYQTH